MNIQNEINRSDTASARKRSATYSGASSVSRRSHFGKEDAQLNSVTDHVDTELPSNEQDEVINRALAEELEKGETQMKKIGKEPKGCWDYLVKYIGMIWQVIGLLILFYEFRFHGNV